VTRIPVNLAAEALPAVVAGDSVYQVVRWKDVPGIERLYAVYCASPVDGPVCADDLDGKTGLIVIYDGQLGRRVGSDWETRIHLSRDFEALRALAEIDAETTLVLKSLEVRITALDEHWTIYDDPYELAQPAALNNVEHGFGYWGSLGVGEFQWVPDAEALDALGVTSQG
jgi:hypothetical protein